MAFIANTTVVNPNTAPVPVSDQPAYLLRRILKLIESFGAADSSQRQRITLDAVSAGITLAGITTVTTVSTVTTVTTCSTVTSVTNVAQVAGMGDEQFINPSRMAYAELIRNRITTSGAVSGP